MAKFIVYFDRSGMDMMIVEGTLVKCRKYIGELMFRPVYVKGKRVLVSHAAVWEYDPKTAPAHGKICYGTYQMGVFDKTRIGMWWDAKSDRYYLMHRDGTLAGEIPQYGDISWVTGARREMRTRAKRVKEM